MPTPGPPVPVPPPNRCTAQASSSASLQAALAPGLGSGPEKRRVVTHGPVRPWREDGWTRWGWGNPSQREREGQELGPWAWL